MRAPQTSPVREYRTPGSARGPPGNRRSYLNGKGMKKLAPFLINCALLIAYLYFDLKVLHQMHVEERHWPQDIGGADSITYICTAGPVLLAMLAFNLGWMAVRCLRLFRERPFKWKASLAPLGVAMLWVGVFLSRSYWLPVLWNVA